MSYTPMKITGMSTGLVQSREKFVLPNDAYPVLQNAFVWREKIKRKQGFQFLSRLRRVIDPAVTLSTQANGATYVKADILADSAFNLRATEPNAQIEPGSVEITVGAHVWLDNLGNGALTSAGGSGTINYSTGALTLAFSPALGAATNVQVIMNYFPSLPAMGIRTRNLNGANLVQTVFFDTKYAYIYNGDGFVEFIPGTTWSGTDFNFFWSTNYWVSADLIPQKLFWVTNDSGILGDPIRYTNGTAWTNFAPVIDVIATKLTQALVILPFRGRLMVLNTLEGDTLANSISYSNRIRWAAIGNPLLADSWRDDIPGKGGFLDIPTSENIMSAGFVRDNLVVFCESSTWQLRYTGRSIAPFQIEKVNTELGSQSTFSSVQFDTSLVGIGDKGIVQCDSFKSDRIDIKIPDLVFSLNETPEGLTRVHGIRDFVQKLAYWIYPSSNFNNVYPNNRLVYNYENDSWATFTDSLTCLGTFQPIESLSWEDSDDSWETSNFSWSSRPKLILDIVAGNQQGFIELLDKQTNNDPSLFIRNIQGNSSTATVVTSPNHNMETGTVIQITGIPDGTPFAHLNNGVFGIILSNISPANAFALYKYNPLTEQFDDAQVDAPGTFIGTGLVAIREGFIIQSKKFNFMDQGQNIQIGYVDVLLDTTARGEITLNVYLNYNENSPSNTYPQNVSTIDQRSDPFFNSVVPTSIPEGTMANNSKIWQRVFCPTRGNFLTLEWTLSNAQLASKAQESDVQIDAQIIWQRPAGRMSCI